jgi:hypothetical protein
MHATITREAQLPTQYSEEATRYSREVSEYQRQLESRFTLSATEEEELGNQLSRTYRRNLVSGLAYLAVGLGLFAAFVWTVGWIARGFLGIPRGQDQPPDKPAP